MNDYSGLLTFSWFYLWMAFWELVVGTVRLAKKYGEIDPWNPKLGEHEELFAHALAILLCALCWPAWHVYCFIKSWR